MIKVLLADDNEFAVRYLESLTDWNALGYEIAGKAYDGEEAWRQYQRLHPQVVILDVQMPGLDGLEVASRIRRQSSDAVILFLSSYDKFDYAREAVHLNAEEYLLKQELDENTLTEKLIRIRRRLEERKENDSLNVRNQLIAAFRMPAKTCAEQKTDRRGGGKKRFFVMEQDHVPEQLEGLFTVSTEERDAEPLIADIQRRVPDVEHLIRFQPYRYAGLFRDGADENRAAHQILNALRGMEGGTFSVYLYGGPQTIEKCREQYRNHLYVFDQRYFDGNGVLMPVDLYEPAAARKADLTPLKKALKSGTAEEAETRFAGFCARILETRDLQGLILLTETVHETMREISPALAEFVWAAVERSGRSLTSARSILQTVRGIIAAFLEMRPGIVSLRSEELTRAVCYLRRNYPDPMVSVEDAAREAGISVTRLNELFRMKMHTTAGKFLTRCRMEAAGRLLRESGESVAGVSERTGFSSTAYFSRAFRKYYGMTPLKWKEQGL